MRELDVTPIRQSGLSIDMHQYMGLWAIEEASFAAQWAAISELGLAAHLAKSPVVKTAPQQTKPAQAKLAQIEIRGTMTKSGSSLSDAGATTMIRQQVRAAMNDPNIDGALILIESPGGTVAGTAELAADLEALAAAKPTITLFEDQGTSAALWAGVMSNKVYAINDHTMVGSLGTYYGMYDMSGAAAKQGIKPVLIRTGELKGAGFPGTELTDAQKQMFQSYVDQAHSAFSSAVKSKRKLNADQMTELNRGGIYSAKAAMDLGLIDGIRSYDAAVAELRGMVGTKRKGVKMTEQASAASLPELEAACRGASESFLIGQLRKGASAQAAAGEWMNSLVADKTELSAQLKTANDSVKSLTDENTKLKGENESLKNGKTTSHAAVKTVPTGEGSASTESATDRFNAEVNAAVKGGKTKSQAISHVTKNNPSLHAEYLAEANQNRSR